MNMVDLMGNGQVLGTEKALTAQVTNLHKASEEARAGDGGGDLDSS